MPEYTYRDIIIDPTSEEAKNCIGKEVYFSDNIRMCLCRANKDINSFTRILQKINEKDYRPFKVDDNYYQVIIPKKEEPKPACIPFKSAVEFLDAYEDANYSITNGTIENRLLNHGGIWLINTVSFDSYMMVTEVWNDGLNLGTDPEVVLWEELLRDYTFLDGTPCGKIKEEDNNG